MSFALKIVNYSKVEKSLAKKYKKLKDKEPFHQKAVIELDKWKNKNFEQEGGLAHGGGWQPLRAATLAQRHAGKILQVTGKLKNEWNLFWNKRKGFIEAKMPYGIYHHKGAGNLPVRRILPTEEQIMPTLKKLLQFEIRKDLK